MTILSNNKKQTNQTSQPGSPLNQNDAQQSTQQQQQQQSSSTTSASSTSNLTSTSVVSPSSTSSSLPTNTNTTNTTTSSTSTKQRLVLLVNNDTIDETVSNSTNQSSSNANVNNKSLVSSVSSSPNSSSLSSSASSSSLNTSTLTTSPDFKLTNTNSTSILLTDSNVVDQTSSLVKQHHELSQPQLDVALSASASLLLKKKNKNNKRKIRTNHNTPMPLPPPQQRQRNVVKTTNDLNSLKQHQHQTEDVLSDLHYTTHATITSLTCLNNSGDEQRLLTNDSDDDDDDDDDSDFDNSDFDLGKFNQTAAMNPNDTSSDNDDSNYFNNFLIQHHRLILQEQENETVLSTLHRNNNNNSTTNNKTLTTATSTNTNKTTKKKSKKNTLLNSSSTKLKRNSTKENNLINNNNLNSSNTNASKKNLDNDYLNNNNSEDEYENRPIMIRNINGLGNYNNNNQIGMNENKSMVAQFDTQNLFNVETIEELESKFCQLLKEKKGFVIKPMKEDGACLFRAVADQIYGDEEMHSTIRSHCMDYIAKNADYFKQYMTEDVNRYISRKRQDTCHGNHIEIIAIAEIYNRPIEVYEYSIEPKNTFQGVFQTDNEPIRLSYHGRNHYNSVVDPFKATIGVGLGLPQMTPGLAEKNLLSEALKKSEEFHLEQTMLDDKLKATDWEATNEEIMEIVARESYLQWLKDNEKRSLNNNSLNIYCDNQSTNAQCSNWLDSSSDLFQQQQQQRISRRSSTSTPPKSPSNQQQSKLSQQIKSSHVSTKSNYDLINSNKTTKTNTNPTTSNTNPTTSSNTYDDSMQYQYYETKSIINELTPDLFGLNNNDWLGLDNSSGNDSDILARVLAASQQEYLESLKAKRNSNKN